MQQELQGSENLTQLANTLIQLLLTAQKDKAFKLVLETLESGISIKDVYLHILQPVMYEIGRLWQIGKIDVAAEHYCTGIIQLLMAQLYSYTQIKERNGHKMLGCCLGSELHDLGLRMVNDFFEIEGWTTSFYGAATPLKDLLNAIERTEPEIICISVTMSRGVPQTKTLIHELANRDLSIQPRTLVGGVAFLINPDLSEKVGADAMTYNAQHAVETAKSFIA